MSGEKITQLFISPSYIPVDSSVTLINSKIIDRLEQELIESVVLTVSVEDTTYNVTPRLLEIFPSKRRVYRVRSYENGSRALLKIREVLRRLLPFVFYLPDYHFVWQFLAILKLFRIRKECRIDIIHSVSAPYCSHIVGYFARLVLRRPWICHLDDFWSDQPAQHFSLFRPANRWLEKKCFEKADVVLSTSKEILQLAGDRYPERIVRKFVYIPPCYEPEHYKGTARRDGGDAAKYRFVYLGVFYPGKRDPVSFLTGMKSIKLNRPDLYSKIEVEFVGTNVEKYRDLTMELDVADAVSFRRNVDYLESVRLMKEACILLHFGYIRGDWSDDIHISGKLFEYLGAERLVLAITTKSGPVADFIRENRGIVADYRDTDDIATHISKLIETYTVDELFAWKSPEHVSHLYSSQSVTRSYISLFQSLTLHARTN